MKQAHGLDLKPLSPFDIRKELPSIKREAIADLIFYVNEILVLHDSSATFSRAGLVQITDASSSPEWGAYHKEVMQQFKDAGWVVEMTNATRPTYWISLPQEVFEAPDES